MFCVANGETYNIPIELAESRYGVQIEQYAFHQEDGGAGQFRGGRGVVLDYRITSDEAFLTVTYSRTASQPWGLMGGSPGSSNRGEIRHADGRIETCNMATGVQLKKGELVHIVMGHGGGFGDPRKRSREAVARDLRDGYITLAQARADYGHVQ